jgi:ABC-type amino acid transport substrate-binding protein
MSEVLLLCVGCLVANAVCVAAPLVRVCFDDADPSALVYRNAAGQLDGAALTLTREALKRAGFSPEFVGLPWVRCQREVEEFGARGQFELAMLASRSADREARFLLSTATHVEHGGIWYLKATHPNGFNLKSRADLINHQLCGIKGANYGWLHALGANRIDQGAIAVQAVLKKLEMRRCDAFPFSFEAAHGVGREGPMPISRMLAFEPYPDVSGFTKHILVSRASPRGSLLKEKLDSALQQLHRSGDADRIYRRYLNSGTGLAQP